MRTDRSGSRIACTRCRANNFVGQAQCWQCGHSLPPPEALHAGVSPLQAQSRPAITPSVPPAAMPPVYINLPPAHTPDYTAGGQNRRGIMPLAISIVLLTAAVVLIFVMRHTSAPSANAFAASELNRNSAGDLNGDAHGVVPERDRPQSVLPDPGGPRLSIPQSGLPDVGGTRLSMPARETLPPSADPNEMAARRAIESALPRLGLPPQTGTDNSVHLRNGDTISRDQYEDVQRKLQGHPLFGGQPPVPRL